MLGKLKIENGSLGRARTADLVIMSKLLSLIIMIAVCYLPHNCQRV